MIRVNSMMFIKLLSMDLHHQFFWMSKAMRQSMLFTQIRMTATRYIMLHILQLLSFGELKKINGPMLHQNFLLL